MDKLTLVDQQKVRKISDERLRAKFVDAGHDRIELTEREKLLDLFAKLLAQTKAGVSISEQGTTVMLKRLLCKATVEPLYIIDFAKPFNLFVDASLHTVSAVLTQTDDDGTELPVAFSSTKLSQAQVAWSTIEREVYAVLVALKKYRSWIFGTKVTVYSDHNPLQYLIESAPKSAKLMRWSLALQEFFLTFKYKSGKTNAAADCLSRL